LSVNQEKIDTHYFTYLAELVGAGKVVPVIGSRYPLSEVAEALRNFGAGHHQGKVVITVKHNNKT
jgi:NADPH:quinone reductase-like Zn-dependent oxidoreductase